DGLAQAEWITDREHDVAGAQFVRAAHRHERRVVDFDPEDGQISIRIRPDDRRRGDPPVCKLNADLVGTLDDMMVRDQMTVAIDDHPGSQAPFYASSYARQ